jgi:hypothetical protein
MSKYPVFWKGYYCDYIQETDTELTFHLDFSSFNIYEQAGHKKLSAEGTD